MKKILILIFIINFSALAKFNWTEIEIPVRDEKNLKADLWASDTTVKKPCIFIQTPYNKELYRGYPVYGPGLNAFFDTSSYSYVIMDWRGFYSNKEVADPQKDRGEDGYDGVEWIAEQNWCNGKIGTSGSSALGMIQFKTARHHPPHLVCCAPFVKDYKTKYTDYYYGGVLRKEHTEQLQKLGFLSIDIITSNPIYNNVWKMIENQSDYSSEIAVPMLMASGWFDHYPSDVIRAFEDIRKNSDKSVRDQHKLIMGPWTHSGLGDTLQGELEFPEAAGVTQQATQMFFAYYLLGAKINWLGTPEIRYFQMGGNIWKTTDNWYSVASYKDTLYLWCDGTLQEKPPTPVIPHELQLVKKIYDPKDPSPTIGGSRFNPFEPETSAGPYDISDTVENRDDIWVFTTAVLIKPIQIAGKIKIHLYIGSDRKDTDFAVRLCDVYPDGKSIILTQGIKRARFRNNIEREIFLQRGIIDEITIELEDIAVTFVEGHRMRIDITSSNYPMFDINPNTGGEMYVPGDTLEAENTVFCDPGYPSKIIIPTILPLKVNESKNWIDDINIFPNPAKDIINIQFEAGYNSKYAMEIFSIFGEKSGESSGILNNGISNIRFKTNQLQTGIYFIKLSTDKKIFFNKFQIIK
ncbi:CocE/NonD family hydrolase [Bacteroidota bacterium]